MTLSVKLRMKPNYDEVLGSELYLLLGLVCSGCHEEWYAQDHGWEVPGATENDVEKMVSVYLPKLIKLGWSVDNHQNILCPKCRR